MSNNEHDPSRPPTQGDDTHTNAEKKESSPPKHSNDPMADSVFQFDEAPFAMDATETDKPAPPTSLTDSGRRGSRAPRTMMAGGEGEDVLHGIIASDKDAGKVVSPSGNMVQGDSDVLQSAISPAKKEGESTAAPSSKKLKGDSDEIARQLLNDSGSLADDESTVEYQSPGVLAESPIEERIVEDSRSEINLTAPPEEKSAPSSGLDLIAEAMESGINLGRTDDFPEGDMLHDDEAASALLDEIHNAPTKADGDSMVDLGAYAALQAMDAEALEREPVSQIMRGAKAASYSEIEVDLNNLKTPPQTSNQEEVGDLIETATEIKPDAGLEMVEGTIEAVNVPSVDEGTEQAAAPRPGLMPWLGGGALGAILGGGLAALAMGMINPPVKPSTPPGNGGAQQFVSPPAPVQVVVDTNGLMRRGEFSQALTALEKETLTDDEKALKGEALWLGYMKSRDPKVALDKNSEDVQKAIKQLQDGGAPVALFWLGQIEEQTGNPEGARKLYQDGQAKAAEPAHKSMFQAALDRLDALYSKVGMTRRLEELPADRREAVVHLAMVLTLLQESGTPQLDEAGFSFWSAVKLARQQKFDEARKKLQEAREKHNLERFRKLRQPQNPLSDPNEEIFLKSADELLDYWALEEYLQAQKLAPAGSSPLAAVTKLVSERGTGGGMDAKALFEKLKGDKSVTEAKDPLKAVEQLMTAKNNAVAQAAKAQMAATEAQTAKTSAEAEVEKARNEAKASVEATDTVRKQLTAVGQSLGLKEGDVNKAVEQVVSDRKTLAELVAGVTKALQEGQLLPANADRKDLLPKVHDLVQQAKAADKEGIVRRKDEEINKLKTELAGRPTGADMMGFALSSLLSQPAAAVKNEELTRSAQALAADQTATPEQRGQAYGVMGLTLRRQGKVAEARQALEKAAEADAKNDTWKKLAQQLESATAFYVPAAEKAVTEGRAAEALNLTNEGLGLFPNEGRLLALRSLAALESARSDKKTMSAEDPRIAAATKDAQAAIAAGAGGQGQFAAGRLAEEQGRLVEAEKLYRQALTTLATSDPLSVRCRIALARVLLRNAQPAPTGGNTDRTAQAEPFADFTRDLMTMVLLVGMQNVQGAGGNSSPQIEEALKLAEEAIAAKVPEGYLIKARALSRKGLWTEALQTYAQGLRDVAPRDYADTLDLIVERHPAFQRPTAAETPEPQMADRHYANGLRYYFSQQYADAEKELVEAVKFNDQDARYLYFLGLSRLALGKTDLAYEDFRQGGQLEERNRPSRFAVSVALERVQGRARQVLNSFRP